MSIQLEEKQLLMLNTLSYCEPFMALMKEAYANADGKPASIGALLKELRDGDNSRFEGVERKAVWEQLVKLASSDFDFEDLYVINVFRNEETGAVAFCVADDPPGEFSEETQAVMVFKGTGSNEWREDAVAATESDVPSQEEAYQWVESLDQNLRNITVIGHSKGGNKAMYVAVRSDRVQECYSFDGQGFSQEFLDKYADQIADKKSRFIRGAMHGI